MQVDETLATDAWHAPLELPFNGRDTYHRVLWCPYCGERGRKCLSRTEGMWVRLRCPACGGRFVVRSRAGRGAADG